MEHQKRIHLAPSLTALTIASISLLLQYRDLPIGSYLSLTVWELAEGRGLALVGCSCMPLFNKKGRLKTGQQKLKIHEGLEAPPLDPSTMLGKVTIPQRSQIGQLEHLMKLYARGDMPHVDWLDTLTFKVMQVTTLSWQANSMFACGMCVHRRNRLAVHRLMLALLCGLTALLCAVA